MYIVCRLISTVMKSENDGENGKEVDKYVHAHHIDIGDAFFTRNKSISDTDGRNDSFEVKIEVKATLKLKSNHVLKKFDIFSVLVRIKKQLLSGFKLVKSQGEQSNANSFKIFRNTLHEIEKYENFHAGKNDNIADHFEWTIQFQFSLLNTELKEQY